MRQLDAVALERLGAILDLRLAGRDLAEIRRLLDGPDPLVLVVQRELRARLARLRSDEQQVATRLAALAGRSDAVGAPRPALETSIQSAPGAKN